MKATILNIIVRDGSYFNRKWKSPMQEIETDKGVFIDNHIYNTAPSAHWIPADYSALIGKEVEFTVHQDTGYIIPDSEVESYRGHQWMHLK